MALFDSCLESPFLHCIHVAEQVYVVLRFPCTVSDFLGIYKDPCSFESPVKHLLHTNLAPTTQERAWISGHILVQSRSELALLDEETQRRQRSLDELNAKRAILAADIDAHLALLSPIRRIPDDILREIFVSCLPQTHNAVISPRKAPLLLCDVTSGWRYVALSTPQLWSSLHLVIPGSREQTENISFLVERWIARSGMRPLSLSIVPAPNICLSPWFSWPPLNLLLAVSNRWQAIEIATYRDDWFSESLYPLSPADVPRLKPVNSIVETQARYILSLQHLTYRPSL
ncbi:hypothetical protein B0H19DRAFT_943958 [Mycena capillaripes]|nr:hypothetical protein B0H19DRAFT_943958 [Mycena capillaripes]